MRPRAPAPPGRLRLLAVVAAGLAAAAAPTRAEAQDAPPVAIENGRIHTGDGQLFDPGTIVLRGDRITAVGAAAEVKAPEGARRIDAKGAWITAGLFDPESTIGLIEVTLDGTTREISLDERYDSVRAAFAAMDGLNPTSVVIPVTRIEGVTTAAVAPRGGLVAGRGAVIDLDGRSADEMVVRTPSAIYVSLGQEAKAATFGARGGLMLRLRELLDDVRQYAKRRQDFERNQMRRVVASRLDLEALVPAVEGKLPVVFEVQKASDIQAILRLAKEEGLKPVLSGCSEGWMVAADIARAGAPVIVRPLSDLPGSFESLGDRLDNPALLARAGVKVAISTRAEEPHNTRNIKQQAGNAVANGLSWEDALRAVTRHPAEIFGVGDRLGTLAAGKTAHVVVWSGDPFETTTRPRHVFIRGREIPLRSRQTELRDRYRDLSGARPRP